MEGTNLYDPYLTFDLPTEPSVGVQISWDLTVGTGPM